MKAERGAVSLHAVTVAVVLVIIAATLTEVGGLIAMRHRAAAAADLAALAGSRASVNGSDGCAAARAAARANAARLVSCRMDYDVATVTARTTSHRWWGHRWTADITARAAPTTYLDP